MEIVETIVKIADFIVFPEFSGWLAVLKFFILGVSIFTIFFIIWVMAIRTDFLRWWLIWDIKEFFTYRPYGLPKVTKKWVKIRERLKNDSESERKSAIIEADALLDKSLKDLKIGGATLEESLRKRIGPYTISNIEEVKRAHQIRNKIVHQPDFSLTLKEAEEVLDIYEKALEDLGML